jgi:hypothetical protein
VQLRAAVLDVLPHALHDRTDEGYGALERILPGGIARGIKALVDGGGAFLVLEHDQQLRLGGCVQV